MDDKTRGVDDAGTTRRAQPARGGSSASVRSTKAKRASVDVSDADREAEARTRRLEEEIAETREDLSETVEAIQEKLRPSHMVSEGTQALKTAATERVRNMADTATRTAHRLAESSKENLWPAVLIGTGVAWLLFDKVRDNQRFDSRTDPYSRYRSGRYNSGAYQSTGYQSAGDEASGSYARNGRTGLQRMLHDNPLLVAAGAVLMGAAVGGALPQTEKENELMGEARDQVVHRAQDAARQAADSVREVASGVQHVAAQVSEPAQH